MSIGSIIREDFLVVSDSTPLSELIGKLRQYEKKAAFVFNNKNYLGVVEKRKLLKTKLDSTAVKVGKFVQSTSILTEEAEPKEAIRLMAAASVNFLPVERDKKIIGAVHAVDVAISAANEGLIKDVKFQEAFVNAGDPLSKAIAFMREHRTDHVAVFEDEKVSGVVSYKDIIRKYLNWSPKRDTSAKFNMEAGSKSAEVDITQLANIPVREISTNHEIISVFSSANILESLEKMKKAGVNSLVVMEAEDFAGIITIQDVLKHLVRSLPSQNGMEVVGLSKLPWTDDQRVRFKDLCHQEIDKMEKVLQQKVEPKIHVKAYEKEGTRNKYSITLRVLGVHTTQEDWKWQAAVHKTFENARNVLKKKFKK